MARKLILELVGDASKLTKSLNDAQSKTEKFGEKIGKVGTKLTKTVTLPIVGIGVGAFKMASDLNESLSAADARFGKSAGAVKNWAKQLDSSFGLTQREALDMVTQLRAVTQNSRLTDDQMLKLAERAADVGSQFNMSASEVGERFRSALTGSTEVLERFGVDIKVGSQGMIDYAKSIGKPVAALTQAEKQAGFYKLIMDQTATTQGDAAATADQAAGRIRTLKADMGRLGEELGQKLIPAFLKVADGVSNVLKWLDDAKIGSDKLVVAMLALGAAGPVLKGIELATKGVAAAQWAWNAAVVANPIVALTGSVIVLHEWIERTTGGLDGVRQSLFSLTNPVKELHGRLLTLRDVLFDVGDKIRNLPGSGVLDKITSLGGLNPFNRKHTGGVVPGPTGHPVPIMALGGETVGRSGSGGGGGGTVVHLTINTQVLDQNAARWIADQMRDGRLIGVSA